MRQADHMRAAAAEDIREKTENRARDPFFKLSASLFFQPLS